MDSLITLANINVYFETCLLFETILIVDMQNYIMASIPSESASLKELQRQLLLSSIFSNSLWKERNDLSFMASVRNFARIDDDGIAANDRVTLVIW